MIPAPAPDTRPAEVARDGFQCPFCSRSFANEFGRWEHAKRKHRGKPLAAIVPAKVRAKDRKAAARQAKKDAEPESYADMAIEAQQLRDAGLPVPEDIAWLIP